MPEYPLIRSQTLTSRGCLFAVHALVALNSATGRCYLPPAPFFVSLVTRSGLLLRRAVLGVRGVPESTDPSGFTLDPLNAALPMVGALGM